MPSTAPISARTKRTAPRILVVEDTPICREPLISALKLKGFDAMGAENGQKALERINSVRPDLVLLDIVMPEMDGWALLRELRSKPEHAKLPVILLTATADREWVARAREFGVREYLLKGQFSMIELFARVYKCLGLRKKPVPPQPVTSGPLAKASATATMATLNVESEVLAHAIALATSLKGTVESLAALIEHHPQLAERVGEAADSTISRPSQNPPDAKLDKVARGVARQAILSITSGAGRAGKAQ
jgi:DNA-binding response OmpR family regulator